MNWTRAVLADFQGRTIKGSALTAVVIPLVGSLGRFPRMVLRHALGKRRAPVCAIMQAGLAAVCVGFTFVPRGEWVVARPARAGRFFDLRPGHAHERAAPVTSAIRVRRPLPRASRCVSGALGSTFSARRGWLKDLAKGDWNLVFYVLAGLGARCGGIHGLHLERRLKAQA